MSRFDPVWRSLDERVASGWAPGIVAGVRHRGETAFYATGVRTAGAPEAMELGTPFRIASLSKPVGGALAALLIADGTLALDEPVERWLPELAHPRVLVDPAGPLDNTVPANTPITVRHLLTFTHGLGFLFEDTPLAAAFWASPTAPGPIPPRLTPDEYVRQIAELPLAHQPGERWMYNTGSDILSVLMARATGIPLRDLLRERILDPLGMTATGFVGDAAQLPTAYVAEEAGLTVFDPPDGEFASPPPFESLACGLVSTVPDYLGFLAALEDGALLPPELKEQLASDQLTARQREGVGQMIAPGASWGWQVSVETARRKPWTAVGRWGWAGGTGTSAYVDPSRDLIGVVFTQRLMAGPNDQFEYFWGPLAAAV